MEADVESIFFLTKIFQ